MKNRLKNINFYLTALAVGSTIDSVTETGSFVVDDVTVNGYQLNDGGSQVFWVVIDSNLENNREMFRITSVNLGTKTLTYDKRSGPNGKKTHTPGALVQINDVAEIFNHIANTIDDFGMAEIAAGGGLDINIYGGEVRSNGIPATIADTTLSLVDNQPTTYIVFDYADNTFKEVGTVQSNHALLYEATTLGGEITSFIDKRGIAFGISTVSATPVFLDAAARDAALPVPSDGMQVALLTEGIYTDYLGGAWIERGNNPTPNASETVAGKVEIATDAQVTAGTSTGETGAKLVATPDQLKKSISLRTAVTSLGDTDEIAVNNGGEDKKITKVNLRETLAASETEKGTVEKATDAEALAGIDEERYIVAKQVKDNYSPILTSYNQMIASNNLKISSDAEKSGNNQTYYEEKKAITLGYYPKTGTIRVSFDLKKTGTISAATVSGRIYKNGVAVGTGRSTTSTTYVTYTEDISVGPNDRISIYTQQGDVYYEASHQIRNFRISYDLVQEVKTPIVNLD